MRGRRPGGAALTVTPAPPQLECPHCGSAVSRGQEYCLECGGRLPLAEPDAVREPAAWLWPVLVALVVAGLATGGVVAWRLAADGGDPELVAATTEQPAVIPTTAPPEAATTAAPTATAPPTTAPPAATTPSTPPPAPRVISWPDGRTGYTIVLASIPEGNGRATATARARDALEAGLTQVGVLRSAEFATLHPGYFVVFSGIHASMQEAEARLGAARSAGFEFPYVRPISR